MFIISIVDEEMNGVRCVEEQIAGDVENAMRERGVGEAEREEAHVVAAVDEIAEKVDQTTRYGDFRVVRLAANGSRVEKCRRVGLAKCERWQRLGDRVGL